VRRRAVLGAQWRGGVLGASASARFDAHARPPPSGPLYPHRRYEKRHKTLSAHASPAFLIKEGDVVTVGQCRPLSKTVRFNVLKVEPATEAGAVRALKVFRSF
jgi:hypothetical protein